MCLTPFLSVQVIDDTTVCVAFLGAWRSEGLTAPGSPYSPVLRK